MPAFLGPSLLYYANEAKISSQIYIVNLKVLSYVPLIKGQGYQRVKLWGMSFRFSGCNPDRSSHRKRILYHAAINELSHLISTVYTTDNIQ